MHIFLTGATGSIGSAVLTQAIAAGHTVTALTRSDTAAGEVTRAGATALPGDLSEPEAWISQAVASDAFIHLANSFDTQMAEKEPRLIAALKAHAAQRPSPFRFLYTGGCWLYGETRNAVATEQSPMRPIASFAWAARAITSLQDTPQLSTAILHPGMVYHEGGGTFARMLTALRAKRPAPIWGDVHIRWPLIHRDDAAAAYLALAQDNALGPFNIVAEQGIAIGEIARVLHAQAGVKTAPAVLPRKYALMRHGPVAEGPMLDQQMSSTRSAEIAWQPRHTDFSRLTYSV